MPASTFRILQQTIPDLQRQLTGRTATRFELVVNRKPAKALGLTTRSLVLARADPVIG
jgi:hypothetical protein